MTNQPELPIKIIVPLDGSTLAEQALTYARALSTGTGEIVLLRVLPAARPVRGLLGDVKVSAEGVLSRAKADATGELEAVADRLKSRSPGLTAIVRIAIGDAAAQIIGEAQEEGADLIVMASHGRGAAGRLAYGSVADRVARTSKIPVLITRPHDELPEFEPVLIQRLLVPLDGSDLAAQALPFAESMAEWLQVPIHLVSAIDLDQHTSLSPTAGGMFSDGIRHELLGELREDLEQVLDRQTESLRRAGLPVESEIVDGQAVSVIENATRDGDIVIMTSHGRGGIGRWVIGSVAEKLVRHCPVPVILIRAKPRAERDELPDSSDSSASVAEA